MEVRRKLTEFESTMAFVVGGGLALIMLAWGMASTLGERANASTLNIMLILGALLLIGGSLVWGFVSRPWAKPDNWSEPFYTGHDEQHGEHHADAHGEAHAESVGAAHIETVKTVGTAETAETAETMTHGPVVAAPAQPDSALIAQEPMAVMAAPSVALQAAPEAAEMAQPEHLEKDNLEKIEGIGPKSAAALAAAGIVTFAQVAAMEPAQLEAIVKGAGVRLVGKADTWPKQAQMAAEGRWAELEQYQHTLRAGREHPAGD